MARELAFDAWLIGPEGLVADGVKHFVLYELCEKDEGEMWSAGHEK